MLNKERKIIITILVLTVVAIGLILFYLFHNLGPNPQFVLPRRRLRIISMTVVAAAVAYASILFQTITTMKIFTPSIIGFDALYMFIQSILVLVFATGGYFITGVPNFLLSVGLMMIFSLAIYGLVFKKGSQNIHFLLLSGMVLSTVFASLTTFIQMLIDPEEFAILQNRLFINFNSVNEVLITVATVVITIAFLISLWYFKYLDVLALGADVATSLGANHRRISRHLLIIIAGITAATTALVGPATFLGLIATNLTYQIIPSYKHRYLVPVAALVSIIFVIGGQLVLSRVFNFSSNLSVVINFVGGLYFMYLLLFKNKRAAS